jgi:hypothetical protein
MVNNVFVPIFIAFISAMVVWISVLVIRKKRS